MNEIDTDAIRAGVHGGALAQYPSLAMADEIDRLRGQVAAGLAAVSDDCDCEDDAYCWMCRVRAALAAEPADFAWCPHEQIDDGGECYSCGCVLPIEELTTAGASPVVSTATDSGADHDSWCDSHDRCRSICRSAPVMPGACVVTRACPGYAAHTAAGATGSTTEPPATHLFEFKDHPRYADLCAHRSGHTGWLYCGLPASDPIHEPTAGCALSHPHAATKRCPG